MSASSELVAHVSHTIIASRRVECGRESCSVGGCGETENQFKGLSSVAPAHAEHPALAGIKPVPSMQPPSAARAAAKPSPPSNKPGCPPGKTLAEVNGHPVCR